MAQAPRVRRLAARMLPRQLFSYQRNVYLLLLFTLGKGFQLSIAALSINLYVVKGLHYSLAFAGVVAAMPAIGALLASIPMGILTDRLGRKPLLIVSGFLNPLALVAIGLSDSQPLLIIASLANGFLASAYWVTNLPILTESTTDDQRVGVLALNNFLLLGVGALGALIGGFVPKLVAAQLQVDAYSAVPLRYGVLAAAAAVFVPAVPLIFLHEPRGRKRVKPDPLTIVEEPYVEAAKFQATATGIEPVDPVGRRAIATLFLKLLIPDLLFTTGEGAVIALLQVFFVARYFLRTDTLGVLFTLAGLIGGATSLTAPRFVRRFGKLRMATSMQYLGAPVILLIGFAPIFPLAACAEFLRQILRGLFEPTYAAFTMERVSTRLRGTLSGFYSVTWSMGFSIGPVVAGFLQQNVSLSASFVIGATCLVVSATLLRIFFGSGQPQHHSAATAAAAR